MRREAASPETDGERSAGKDKKLHWLRMKRSEDPDSARETGGRPSGMRRWPTDKPGATAPLVFFFFSGFGCARAPSTCTHARAPAYLRECANGLKLSMSRHNEHLCIM